MPPDYRKEQDAHENSGQQSLDDPAAQVQPRDRNESPRDSKDATIDRTGHGHFPDRRAPNRHDRSNRDTE